MLHAERHANYVRLERAHQEGRAGAPEVAAQESPCGGQSLHKSAKKEYAAYHIHTPPRAEREQRSARKGIGRLHARAHTDMYTRRD